METLIQAPIRRTIVYHGQGFCLNFPRQLFWKFAYLTEAQYLATAFLDENNQLYATTLPNINEIYVCFGNSLSNKSKLPLREWVNCFWNSQFSNSYGNATRHLQEWQNTQNWQTLRESCKLPVKLNGDKFELTERPLVTSLEYYYFPNCDRHYKRVLFDASFEIEIVK